MRYTPPITCTDNCWRSPLYLIGSVHPGAIISAPESNNLLAIL